MVKINKMRNLIFIAFFAFVACNKESTNLSGTYNRVGSVDNCQFVSDSVIESITFYPNGTFVSTKGNGTYNENTLILNGDNSTLRIESRMVYIDNLAYFNSHTN